jgi:GNAT superfamily N-acetyltransferase
MSQDLMLIHGQEAQDWRFVVAAISGTYFGVGRTPEDIRKCCNASVCFGVRDRRLNQQVAFARVVSDGTIYSYLADVVVHPMMRKRGIGRFLIQGIIDDPVLRHTNINLCTRDADGFYRKFGFADGQQLFLRAR